ncbi:uncharacterized protein [Manis javanica]|uniref:uncharacterized protein n=1 Tax=Manis javanica TaxID=9974 RepID=UPI001879C57C|nr:caskin-1-like isoform X1 [Manis javanica]
MLVDPVASPLSLKGEPRPAQPPPASLLTRPCLASNASPREGAAGSPGSTPTPATCKPGIANDAGKRELGFRQVQVWVHRGHREGPNIRTGCCPAGNHKNPGWAQTLVSTGHWPPPTLPALQRPGFLSSRMLQPEGSQASELGQLLGPGGVTASSATRPMTLPDTCHAASTVATPSARRVYASWTCRPMSSAGSPALSAARAYPRPVGGWPCWTSTWPPSWRSRPSGSRLEQSPSPLPPSKAAQPSLSSRLGSAPAWDPSPTFPSPDAAAGAAAPSAGAPQAALRSELWPLPLLAGSCCLWQACFRTFAGRTACLGQSGHSKLGSSPCGYPLATA